jgi:hypothetical protein
MIGRIGDAVINVRNGKRGSVAMPPNGAFGVFSTVVRFCDDDGGGIEEFPDSHLRLCREEDPPPITAVRFASGPLTPDIQVRVQANRNGTATVSGALPGGPPVTLFNVPVRNGEVVLPDNAFSEIHR